MQLRLVNWLIVIVGSIVLLSGCVGLGSSEGSATIQDLNPLNDHLNADIHDMHVAFLQELTGISERLAIEESFDRQMEYVPLVYLAVQEGITVTEEEAQERAQLDREYGLSEQREQHKEWVIHYVNITEKEYWDAFIINDYKEELMIEKLVAAEMERTNNDDELDVFIDLQQQAIKQFQEEQQEQIESFKEEIGL